MCLSADHSEAPRGSKQISDYTNDVIFIHFRKRNQENLVFTKKLLTINSFTIDYELLRPFVSKN